MGIRQLTPFVLPRKSNYNDSPMRSEELAKLKEERSLVDGDVCDLLLKYGRSILLSEAMQQEKAFVQHGNTTTYEHSINVALTALLIAKARKKPVHIKSLIVGSLLHDYFLYDWHVKPHPKHHATKHGKYALENAERDLGPLNEIEKDMIRKHMFPVGPWFPFLRETRILSVADKKASFLETKKKSGYLMTERTFILNSLENMTSD